VGGGVPIDTGERPLGELDVAGVLILANTTSAKAMSAAVNGPAAEGTLPTLVATKSAKWC
jgi:hypothetical protein